MYIMIKTVAMGTIRIAEIKGQDVTISSSVENETLDSYLDKGWELIEIVTHRSEKKDQTGMVAVIGLRNKSKK